MSHTNTTSTAPSGANPRSPGAVQSLLKGVDWHRYVIYIAFVVVFAFFAVLLR